MSETNAKPVVYLMPAGRPVLVGLVTGPEPKQIPPPDAAGERPEPLRADGAAGGPPAPTEGGRLYARRDVEAQGDAYFRHLHAMGREGLHGKSDIAAELAHRDLAIAELTDQLRSPWVLTRHATPRACEQVVGDYGDGEPAVVLLYHGREEWDRWHPQCKHWVRCDAPARWARVPALAEYLPRKDGQQG